MKLGAIILAAFQLWLIAQKIGNVGIVGTWSWWFVFAPVWLVIIGIAALWIQFSDDV